jgi:hypothetical protein
MCVGLVDRCIVELSPREGPVWGRKVATFLDPGRRREEIDLVPPIRSSEDCEVLRRRRSVVEEDSMASGCGSDETNWRPAVSLGFDIAD